MTPPLNPRKAGAPFPTLRGDLKSVRVDRLMMAGTYRCARPCGHFT